MTVELNHLVITTRDNREGADFMADILGLEPMPAMGHFIPLQMTNGVTLDFYTVQDHREEVAHYAFLVTDEGFDYGLERLQARQVTYYSTPFMDRPGEINTNDGGRGLYFYDPTGNTMELITVPYGGWATPR